MSERLAMRIASGRVSTSPSTRQKPVQSSRYFRDGFESSNIAKRPDLLENKHSAFSRKLPDLSNSSSWIFVILFDPDNQ